MRQKKYSVCLMLLIVLSVPHPTVAQSARLGNRSHVAESADATIFYTTTIAIPTYPYAAYLYDAYNATYNMT